MSRSASQPRPRPAKKPSRPKQPAKTRAVYLSALEVENMRVFGRRQRLDFCDNDGRLSQWTFILAPNGGGKTTLLRAIVAAHTAVANREPLGYPGFQQLPIQDHFGRNSEDEARTWITMSRRQFGLAERAQSIDATVACMIAMNRRTVPWREHDSNVMTILDSDFDHKLAAELFLLAYGAPRMVSASGARNSQGRDRTFETLFDEDATLRDPQNWLFETDIVERRKSGTGPRLAMIEKILADILPDVDAVRIGFNKAGSPEAQFKTQDGWIPYHAMSHGYRTMMGWVIDFASRMVQRYPDSKTPLAEPAVVLVDEIDLHLHPVWQRRLIAELTRNFPRTQFIVTAHSPLVVQAAEKANLAVLRRDTHTGEMLIDNEPGNISGWRVDQILTSDLFGIESARSPIQQDKIDRRVQLIRKSRLTPKEADELRQLNEAVLSMPVLERKED
ncbi:MAG TPA: hypothetical protein DCL48_12950, partial [Alphaproteobacteria bacterium]|nr:hypothetical protein [Alphaproteobacteria bacterium]